MPRDLIFASTRSHAGMT